MAAINSEQGFKTEIMSCKVFDMSNLQTSINILDFHANNAI